MTDSQDDDKLDCPLHGPHEFASVTIPVSNQSFDVVVSSGTLEHAANIVSSMAEIRRILKPGGWFLIFRFPNEYSISEWIARRSGRWSHAVRMSKNEMRFLLRLFSFRVVDIGYDSFLPIFLGHRLRWMRPWRTRLDKPISFLDQFLTKAPFVSQLSTSIRCVAHVNDEYDYLFSQG